MIKGYRTYILAVAIFVLGGLQALGVEVPHANEIMVMLGGMGAWTMRAAVDR